jgi:hypothetical protein
MLVRRVDVEHERSCRDQLSSRVTAERRYCWVRLKSIRNVDAHADALRTEGDRHAAA